MAVSTSSDHNIHGHHHLHNHNQYPAAKKSLQIKQDDKFFSRLMSKETSTANSSCRVYYGEASGAVPFMWESQPGTPKHPFSDTSMNPPLTPPPSYSASSAANSKSQSMQNNKISKPKLLANTIFFLKKSSVKSSSAVSSLSSSSSSSSWSSSNSSASSLTNQKLGRPCRRRRCLSGSGIPFDVYDYDEHESDHESQTSTLSCFSVINSKQTKWNNGDNSGGCYPIGNLKNAFLCIVRHGSSAHGQGTSA
ncbi:hypothetical protein FNV43_RR24402 [Rhamnella rubrinervis]|uniref:Uncharacterized protein n=1 Tax=Rhamnella rubrinervis TaxID=2594499 RepID=A0A8K0GT46_9ROSA|nr:hypothetical protein FNV43_RR24402 [Rhamnella rubrinervis]